jgi:putative FmdB family regulatory protein
VPTYDYQCRSCDAVTEVIHAMTADGPTVCERCGGELRRVLYPAGIIFKGSGFYRTDSRTNGSETSPAKGTGSEVKGSEAPSDTGASSATTTKPSTSGDASG